MGAPEIEILSPPGPTIVGHPKPAEGAPTKLRDYLKLVHQTGNARFYGCSLAAATFGVTPESLLPEAAGIVSSDWFLNEKAIAADHCQ
ncbi:MAG: hypothetical protein ACKVVP_21405, partial [Chloroflexota bacterium]